MASLLVHGVPMESSQLSPTSKAATRPRFQFRLRTLLILMLLLCIPLHLVAVKLQQDRLRRQAFAELRSIGLQITIRSGPDGPFAEFLCIRPGLDDDDLPYLAGHLSVLTRRHDLGLSRGLVIDSIDLSNSRVTPRGVSQLQGSFPHTAIRLPP